MTEIEMPDVIGATRRAETIRQGMISYSAAMDAIGEAYEARDWVTLKYPDWDTYCEKEFSEKRLKLTRTQREQAILAFRGAGMSTRAIASALGVSDGTVRNDLAGAQNYAPAEVRGTDGKTYSPTKTSPDTAVPEDGEEDAADHGGSAASSEPRETSGLVDDPRVDESGANQPATAAPVEAEDGGPSSAADVNTPSAPTTGEDSAPVESPVDEPEPSGAGVSRSAPAIPAWLALVTAVNSSVYDLTGLDAAAVADVIDDDLFGDLGLAVSKLGIWYSTALKRREQTQA